MEKTFNFTVNGRPRSVTTEADRSLLDVLREDLHLTGTKYGCGEGRCRACTVLIDGQATVSCLTTIAEVDKQNIVTIEGLASGDRLHPVQEAFLEAAALQCGACTPGLILEVVGSLNKRPRPAETEILARMDKHICRCCGYPKIIQAVKLAVAQAGR